jgi:hypothetical protein
MALAVAAGSLTLSTLVAPLIPAVGRHQLRRCALQSE